MLGRIWRSCYVDQRRFGYIVGSGNCRPEKTMVATQQEDCEETKGTVTMRRRGFTRPLNPENTGSKATSQ